MASNVLTDILFLAGSCEAKHRRANTYVLGTPNQICVLNTGKSVCLTKGHVRLWSPDQPKYILLPTACRFYPFSESTHSQILPILARPSFRVLKLEEESGCQDAPPEQAGRQAGGRQVCRPKSISFVIVRGSISEFGWAVNRCGDCLTQNLTLKCVNKQINK